MIRSEVVGRTFSHRIASAQNSKRLRHERLEQGNIAGCIL